MNLYGFASGDPVNHSDPFGLCDDGKPCPGDEQKSAIERGFRTALASIVTAALEASAAIGNAVFHVGDIFTLGGGNPTESGAGARVGAAVSLAASGMGALGAVEKAAARLTTAQAIDLAEHLGYRIAKDVPFATRGQKAFWNGSNFISQDIDMHKGVSSTWKMFSRDGRRLGTFDGLLKTRIGN